MKTPLEYCVSAIRALRAKKADGSFTADTDGYSISGRSRTASSSPLNRLGAMMLFDRGAPDGYPEAAAPWISAGTLSQRVRYIQTFLMAETDANKDDAISGGNNNVSDPAALVKLKLAQADQAKADAVVDYFLKTLFPGEGKGNLQYYRKAAIDFLNTSDTGSAASLFSSLSPGAAEYDTRVRAMVSFLMTTPRFQEQ